MMVILIVALLTLLIIISNNNLILKNFEIKIAEIVSLHKSYLVNYKKAKLIYKKKNGRISGWVPDQRFLNSLNPKQKKLDNLQNIAKSIRDFEKGLKSPESIPSIKKSISENKYYISKIYRKYRNQIFLFSAPSCDSQFAGKENRY